jgi:hypothetical protein
MTRAPRTSENVENTKPEPVADVVPALDLGETDTNFVVPFAITKVEASKRMTRIARPAGLDCDGLRSATQEVRMNLGLSRPRRPKRLPRLLARREVVAFFGAVDAGGNLRDQVMLRMLASTGMRVAEVVAIECELVDLEALRVKVVQGKGSKDRTTLSPASFRLALQAYIEPRSGALFLGRLGKLPSTRRIQQLVADYGKLTGLDDLHPHLFHNVIFTSKGLRDIRRCEVDRGLLQRRTVALHARACRPCGLRAALRRQPQRALVAQPGCRLSSGKLIGTENEESNQKNTASERPDIADPLVGYFPGLFRLFGEFRLAFNLEHGKLDLDGWR